MKIRAFLSAMGVCVLVAQTPVQQRPVQADEPTRIQVDVTRVGGITEWLQVADMALCFNCPVIPHTADGGQVHQHLVAATQNSPMQEYVPLAGKLWIDQVEIREGWLQLPETPGASTDFIPEVFEKHRVA